MYNEITVGFVDSDIFELEAEIDGYMNVLMGREEPPLEKGIFTRFEVASTYLQRGLEIAARLHRADRKGLVKRNDPLYKFRTGELEDFIAMAKAARDQGSRQITAAQLERDLERFY